MQLEISMRCPVYRQQAKEWGNCEGEIELIEIIKRANHLPMYLGRCMACGVQIRFTIKPLITETTSNPQTSTEQRKLSICHIPTIL